MKREHDHGDGESWQKRRAISEKDGVDGKGG